ncbi:hypothetical protein ILT44_16040 [Microvirga sp. BT689]|uniref:hypothetical protein n=1 Tax=Microvirga arvi TaxID=2778731 RepID=UPI00194FED80|nr:hypothetical protein [Microvirga arvi]MBM6581709.1 hypothetical protein [Microvirga arvi]
MALDWAGDYMIRRVALAVEVRSLCGRLMFAASFSVEDWKISLMRSRTRGRDQEQDLAEVACGRPRPYQSLFSVGGDARRAFFGGIYSLCNASALPVDRSRNIPLAPAPKAFIHGREIFNRRPAARETAWADFRLPKAQKLGSDCRYAPPSGSQVDAWQP